MSELRLSGVKKRYDDGQEAIHGIDLTVKDGEFVVFVGPSGCGKSTLLRMIAGLESISEGTISLDNQIINDLPPRAREISMVFQDYALYPHMTVYENMAFGLKMRKTPESEIQKRVKEAAEMLQIDHLLARKPRQMSGGQRQRVAMGRAIVRNARIFLYDEPLSNLDAQLRNEMRTEIKRLHQRIGATSVYVTHDQVEAMTLADRIAVLQSGELRQYDTPEVIYNRPVAKFVAGFTGSPPMNFLNAKITGQSNDYALDFGGAVFQPLPKQRAILAKLASAGETDIEFGIRPEDVHLSQGGGRNLCFIPANVSLLEPLGSEIQVRLSVGSQELVGRFSNAERFSVGGNVSLGFDLDKCHLFHKKSGIAIGFS